MSWPERIEGAGFVLRTWRASDAEALVVHANDPQVSRCLGDRFPHPYTLDDAHLFIAHALHLPGERTYAIEINGEACGGIGAHPGEGVERHSAELGYWLGRAYWGEGIATAAVRAIVPHALRELKLYRLQARVFADNHASMKVLDRCGFLHEAVLRRLVVKGDRLLDMHIYAITRDRLDAQQ
ncbi:MAG TPA: GNAT family protein [Xanthomonadaceae bacterium]|jgi:RimJ/RimL family protein N-acetyltransferase|nr:GNAT family protein [Xanthomonadaceae bacterium]